MVDKIHIYSNQSHMKEIIQCYTSSNVTSFNQGSDLQTTVKAYTGNIYFQCPCLILIQNFFEIVKIFSTRVLCYRRTLPDKRQNFTHFKVWSFLEGQCQLYCSSVVTSIYHWKDYCFRFLLITLSLTNYISSSRYTCFFLCS